VDSRKFLPDELRFAREVIPNNLSARQLLSFKQAIHPESWFPPTVAISRRGRIKAVATRKSDGLTLAIEHTIIEPFVGEKADFAVFRKSPFLQLEQDTTLIVPQKWVQVFIPTAILRGRKQNQQLALAESLRCWMKLNSLCLEAQRQRQGEYPWRITGVPDYPDREVTLRIDVVSLRGAGKLHIRRQQIRNDLHEVIGKALTKKLPKLVSTVAAKRILMLERQHMNFVPKQILDEVERQRPLFPALAQVNELWIVETMGFDDGYLHFEHYQGSECVDMLSFDGPELFGS
jgi:hypothetical protein